MVGAPAVVNIP